MNRLAKKIKVLLGMVKEKFETAKLSDGSTISFDALEINREIYDADGNFLKEGEYLLEDGTRIEVDENGVIKEIVKADGEVEREEVVEQMAENDGAGVSKSTDGVSVPKGSEDGKPAEKPTADSRQAEKEVETTSTETKTIAIDKSNKTEELAERVEALEKSVDEIYEMVLRISEKLKDGEAKVTETVEAFSRIKAEPSAAPVHFGGKNTCEEKTLSPSELFLEFRDKIKKKSY